MTSDVPQTVLLTLKEVDTEHADTRAHVHTCRETTGLRAAVSHLDGKSPPFPKHSCDRSPEHTWGGGTAFTCLLDTRSEQTPGHAHLKSSDPSPTQWLLRPLPATKCMNKTPSYGIW